LLMTELSPTRKAGSDRAALAMLFTGALLVRVVAALVVEKAARARGTLCLFDDTNIYWHLAGTIRANAPFVVDQFGVAHFALRTPGYPLFLAACQLVFGATNTLGPRLVQAALGAACVPMVFGLTRRVWPRNRWAALVAAALAAFEPYWAATSALLLSEAVFVPLMLAMLWGLAALWPPGGQPGTAGQGPPYGFVAGVAAGAAILVKPSWALAPFALIGVWLAATRTRNSVRLAAVVAIALVATLSPWIVRNARVLGRFVPTALWAGASLYDGLNPSADGSSDMRFLARPEFRNLDEVEQDRALRDSALAFARSNPGRAASLAVVKAGRFWSPWPNASEFRATWTNLASAAVTLPVFSLLAIGVWDRRRDLRALALLAGPLAYFLALHLIFVSSIRYRIPAMVPAFGLVGAGFARLVGRSMGDGGRGDGGWI
jgi:4-amino-4-deoxy-L-arabinose transferase-like glycosyltransferase